MIPVIPGITHAPGDWAALEHHLGTELRLVQKPPYPVSGRKKSGMTDAVRLAWEKDWQATVADAVKDQRFIIAQSEGCRRALEVADEGITLALLNPVTRKAYNVLGSEGTLPQEAPQKERMVDAALYPLCRTMPAELYQKLLQRHIAVYGDCFRDILTYESPVKTDLANHMERLLREGPDTPSILFVGEDDPWDDQARRQELLETRLQSRTVLVKSGHFCHVEQPEEIARQIKLLY